MWHWNSLWAPAPSDPSASRGDPSYWRTPFTTEHPFAAQARHWEVLMNASQSWWSFWLSAVPAPLRVATSPTALNTTEEDQADELVDFDEDRVPAREASRRSSTSSDRRPKRSSPRTSATRR